MKRCRHCRELFTPRNSLHVVCSPDCAIAYAGTAESERLQRAARRGELREYRVRTESLSDATRKAQAACNRYVRARDAGKPCISCGALPGDTVYGGNRDAGHYRSTGACPQLRFEPLNIQIQCTRCNRQLSGNHVAYRAGLLERIGADRVAWLEGPHPIPKWTVADLKGIARNFAAMTRAIEKQRESTHEG